MPDRPRRRPRQRPGDCTKRSAGRRTTSRYCQESMDAAVRKSTAQVLWWLQAKSLEVLNDSRRTIAEDELLVVNYSLALSSLSCLCMFVWLNLIMGFGTGFLALSCAVGIPSVLWSAVSSVARFTDQDIVGAGFPMRRYPLRDVTAISLIPNNRISGVAIIAVDGNLGRRKVQAVAVAGTRRKRFEPVLRSLQYLVANPGATVQLPRYWGSW